MNVCVFESDNDQTSKRLEFSHSRVEHNIFCGRKNTSRCRVSELRQQEHPGDLRAREGRDGF
jgi:hypothetical protein